MNKNKRVISVIERMPQWVYLLILFLFQSVFVPQGLDFADEGFFMTFYQQIFNDPQSVTYAFMYWFAGILGGSLYSVFPEGGILLMRLAGVVIITLTAAVTCIVLKPYLRLWAIRVGVAMSVLYIFDDVISLYYNNVSALLYVCAIGLLLKGLRQENGFSWIFGGAMLFSLNSFTRIPNVLGALFGILILYECWISRRGVQWCSKAVVSFVSGYFLMVILVFLLMWTLGHIAPFFTCMGWIFHIGGISDSSHNLVSLFRVSVKQYIEIVFLGVFLLLWGGLFLYLVKRFRNRLILGIICFLAIWLTVRLLYFSGALYLLYFLSLTTVLFILWKEKPEMKTVALAAGLLLVLQPLGSDGAVDLVGRYSMWLTLPLFVAYIGRQVRRFSVSRGISDSFLNRTGWIVFTLFIFTSVGKHVYYTYFDQGSRLEKIYSVDNPFLRGVYTSEKRALLAQEVIAALKKHTRPGDYTLIYDNSPILHYVTETRPYAYNPWLYLYDKELLGRALSRAQVDRSCLPVVVLQKFKGLWIDWPDGYSDEYMSEESNRGKNSLMRSFLQKNQYRKIWSDGYYEIWTPEERK